MNLYPYTIDEKYSTQVAYFSMEFAIDQALKTYSGGLGFLAGSHVRSANDRRQKFIGAGMLWSYGYYEQELKKVLTISKHSYYIIFAAFRF